jgi:aspartate aminotransferase-like enzyme
MIFELLWTHYRLGYTRLLLYCDSLLMVLLLIDFISYSSNTLSLKAALSASIPFPHDLLAKLAVFLLFLLVILPALLSVMKVIGVPGVVLANPARQPLAILASHLLVCLLLVYATFVTHNMEALSGWRQDGQRFLPEFHSAFATIVGSSLFIRGITLLGSLGGVAASGIIGFLLVGKEPSKLLKQYLTRAKLADLSSDFRPRQIGRFSSDPHVGAAPSTPAAETRMQRLLVRYYVKSATGSERKVIIDEALADCEKIIRECLFDKDSLQNSATAKDFEISILSGPGRAFEAAIRRAGPVKNVVLSPYSTPGVDGLFRAYASAARTNYVKLRMSAKGYYHAWTVQLHDILEDLAGQTVNPGPAVLVVSEVSYATGLRIPVEELLQAVRDKISDLYVIIDGTKAVGNHMRIPIRGTWDAYVFEPSKWLMVTERCGVVVSKKKELDAADYGLIRKGVRKRDEEVRTIASLSSALQVIETVGLEYYWNRCDQLRRAFVAGLPRSFQIVGSNSDLETTYLLSCYPADPSDWKTERKRLIESVGSACSFASTIIIDPDRPWVRVALPYHLDPRELNKLNSFLDDNST